MGGRRNALTLVVTVVEPIPGLVACFIRDAVLLAPTEFVTADRCACSAGLRRCPPTHVELGGVGRDCRCGKPGRDPGHVPGGELHLVRCDDTAVPQFEQPPKQVQVRGHVICGVRVKAYWHNGSSLGWESSRDALCEGFENPLAESVLRLYLGVPLFAVGLDAKVNLEPCRGRGVCQDRSRAAFESTGRSPHHRRNRRPLNRQGVGLRSAVLSNSDYVYLIVTVVECDRRALLPALQRNFLGAERGFHVDRS